MGGSWNMDTASHHPSHGWPWISIETCCDLGVPHDLRNHHRLLSCAGTTDWIMAMALALSGGQVWLWHWLFLADWASSTGRYIHFRSNIPLTNLLVTGVRWPLCKWHKPSEGTYSPGLLPRYSAGWSSSKSGSRPGRCRSKSKPWKFRGRFDEMSGVKDCLGPNNQGIGRKEAYDQQKLVVITSKGIWLAQIYQNYRPAKA